ncbi:MAG: hypothetical protein ABS36_16500 [Acidobacteria bacterium SCN 69-37]|nr:MAG: hypothetical protein ABS36_16500 [Acidobacteria bacterium SCN 69-37]
MRVAVFTDNDFDKINGVTTTWRAVLEEMRTPGSVRIFTAAETDVEAPDYFATASFGVGLPWYREMRAYWPRVRRMLRQLDADRISVVHLATPGPVGLAGRWIAARRRLPVVGSYHTELGEYVRVLSGSPRLGTAFDAYMRWFYRPCASLLVPSVATAERLAAFDYAPDLRLWPRGVNGERFSPARRSDSWRRTWRVDDRRPAILYAGRLSAEKGLRVIGDVQRLLHRHAVDHRMIFVGDGPLDLELRRLVPGAVFTGALPHDQVAIAMASADLFLFPSATDTFGNVVLEAQASGLPVVVSDRGGPCQQMRPGVTGTVCPAGDATAFAGAVLELVRDPSRRRAVAAAARDYAVGRSWAAATAPLRAAWADAQTAAALARRPADPTRARVSATAPRAS